MKTGQEREATECGNCWQNTHGNCKGPWNCSVISLNHNSRILGPEMATQLAQQALQIKDRNQDTLT